MLFIFCIKQLLLIKYKNFVFFSIEVLCFFNFKANLNRKFEINTQASIPLRQLWLLYEVWQGSEFKNKTKQELKLDSTAACFKSEPKAEKEGDKSDAMMAMATGTISLVYFQENSIQINILWWCGQLFLIKYKTETEILRLEASFPLSSL